MVGSVQYIFDLTRGVAKRKGRGGVEGDLLLLITFSLCLCASYVERLVNLLDLEQNVFLDAMEAEAEAALASGDPDRIRALNGQFALVH